MNDRKSIATLTREHIEDSFQSLPLEDFRKVTDLEDMVVKQARSAVVKYVMERVGGNQVHGAAILGINRNTLRKRLKECGLT